MKQSVVAELKRQIEVARKNGYPNMDVKFALNQAKKDYLATPRKERQNFSIFE